MLDLIIRNATVVNADGRHQLDVAVRDGRIVALGQSADFAPAHTPVDAAGLYSVSYTPLTLPTNKKV